MLLYPEIRLSRSKSCYEYEETKEVGRFFSTSRLVKTGRIKKAVLHYEFKVKTNVRLKHNGEWYIIEVSDTEVVIPERIKAYNVERLINKVLKEAEKVRKYFAFPEGDLPEFIIPEKKYRDHWDERRPCKSSEILL